ncbi:MAG: restriction endonuclease [Candidatus Didemnitutus sp.]|nr:restriction endonuclease [Candidatus Didemnitutus sp.]
MSKNAWMVRAGEGGQRIDEFAKGLVTIGWPEAGEIKDASQRDLRLRLLEVYSTSKPGAVQNTASVLWRFACELKVGDLVVTADTAKREYLIGEIAGNYRYDAKRKDHPHVREVTWQHRVSRDVLGVATRNSLGSTLTLFMIPDEALVDLLAAAKGRKSPETPGGLADKKAELEQSNEDAAQEAIELVQDKILELDDKEMQELAAAILRAMGYRTRVSPQGPDRGVDVLASPDGLGLQEPRIKVEVKHRPKSAMGSPEVRSFLGSLRAGDKGLYVSTGGFTKEAKYEAERANIPLTLIDLSDLAQLVTEHYETFDPRGRALIPLVKIYRPAE